jgi:hypothetical protein
VLTADEVCSLLGRFRFSFATENDLQQGLADALISLGLDPEREVRLGSAGRIDLLVDGVGIEVKVTGQPARVSAQLRRYAERSEVRELLLVTTRARHRPPYELSGKPCRVHLIA